MEWNLGSLPSRNEDSKPPNCGFVRTCRRNDCYQNRKTKMGPEDPTQEDPQVFFVIRAGWDGTNMGVSKNRGTPKSSISIGFSIINHPFWGTTIFGNTHIYKSYPSVFCPATCTWKCRFGAARRFGNIDMTFHELRNSWRWGEWINLNTTTYSNLASTSLQQSCHASSPFQVSNVGLHRAKG